MNKNIIIEGPDNVGKSTLIKNIKNYFNDYTFHTVHYSNVRHNSKEEGIEYSKKLYKELFEMFSHLKEKEKTGIICDRAHLGEMVYGPIYRNYPGDYVLDLEPDDDNIYLIVLIDDPERLIKRDDGLSFSTDMDIKKKEIDNFLNAYEKSKIRRKILINVKYHNEKETLEEAIKLIKGYRLHDHD